MFPQDVSGCITLPTSCDKSHLEQRAAAFPLFLSFFFWYFLPISWIVCLLFTLGLITFDMAVEGLDGNLPGFSPLRVFYLNSSQ